MTWLVPIVIAVAVLGGYALGRRHEREAQREALQRSDAIAAEVESRRTPGRPTNLDVEPSVVRPARVRRARWGSPPPRRQ